MSIKENLAKVRESIQAAALRAGRDPDDIILIVVSKQASVAQMQQAYEAGIRRFGESRFQDAVSKIEMLPKDIEWHFIGSVQSNKANKIVQHFHCIHSIDSLRTASVISEKCILSGKKMPCFVQLNIAQEETKHGFSEMDFLQCQEKLHSLTGLQICGLMAMGPHTKDKEKIRACFRSVKNIQARFLKDNTLLYPFLSMGMSEDYEIAIEEGATHIRIGSALFG
jgi:PLP dependent protein